MLKDFGVTALTVSELLRKNQLGRGKNTPILGLNSFIIISGERNKPAFHACNVNIIFIFFTVTIIPNKF